MADESKPDEKEEEITEEPKEKSEIQTIEDSEEQIESKEEVTDEEEIKEKEDEATDDNNKEVDKEPEPESDIKPPKETQEPTDIEPVKAEKPEEKAPANKEKPRKDRGPDFKYIVRISNTDIDGEKSIVYGLTSIKGIGLHMATFIVDETGINRFGKMGDLTDAQVEKLQNAIDNIGNNAPTWMMNRRKDYETGKNTHLISSEIDMQLRDEINIMKKIRSYRGIRHERGLRVRGQRTRGNNRRGLALGVSKKRET